MAFRFDFTLVVIVAAAPPEGLGTAVSPASGRVSRSAATSCRRRGGRRSPPHNKVKSRRRRIRASARLKDGWCTRVALYLSRDVQGTPQNSADRERTPPIIKLGTGTNFGVLGL